VPGKKEGPSEEPPAATPRAREHRTLKLMEGGEDAGLSPAERRRARAEREHLKAVYEPTPFGVPAWRVEGAHGQSYRILVPAFPDREGAQCSCPDFLTRGLGTCKHLEATLAQAAASPPEELRASRAPPPPSLSWSEIEAAQEEVAGRLAGPRPLSNPELALALRRVGKRLTASP
jgi:hypothetical protein